jgi:hypothetical protein
MFAAIVAILGPAPWNSRNLRTKVALDGVSLQISEASDL